MLQRVIPYIELIAGPDAGIIPLDHPAMMMRSVQSDDFGANFWLLHRSRRTKLDQKRSSPHQKNQNVQNWVLLIRFEPRMFCTRNRNHTSRPTGHADAICEVQ